MHFRLRTAIALAAVVLFSVFLIPALWAQDGAGQNPPAEQTAQSPEERAFAKAVQLERDNRRMEALNEYREVSNRNRGRDSEIAGEALYRGGIYAIERYGTNELERRNGQDYALDMWRQLLRNFPDTRAAKKLTAQGPAGEPSRWEQLSSAILKRNSPDIRYQILHALVAMTGSQPAFSYALALILLAVLVKLILWPLTKKQYASMREMQRMQPMVKELQAKYKDAPPDKKVELNQKVMELYKSHGVNPFAGCLPMLMMLPFFFLVFTMIQLYELAFEKGYFLWIGSPLAESGAKFLNTNLFGRNLADPDIPLLALYAVSNYVTMRLTPATDPQQQQQQNTMALMMSGFFFFMFISYSWPSAFVLYWLALNLISIWQQYEFVYKPHVEKKKTESTGSTPGPNGAGSPPEEIKPVGQPKPPARVRPRKKRR